METICTRFKWPGIAAVIVSVVHVCLGPMNSPFLLDGRDVPAITANLFHAGGHDDPNSLQANKGRSFQGCVVVGTGFSFDDTDKSGAANPISAMQALVTKSPRNAERLFPYIGGEETNDCATHAHRRYVINFGDMNENECRSKWPDLMRLVEEKVKPERIASAKGGSADRKKRGELWWRFSRTAKDLYEAIRGLPRVLVRSLTSSNFSTFTFLPTGPVYDQTLIVFASDTFQMLAALCSRIHECWAFFSGQQ